MKIRFAKTLFLISVCSLGIMPSYARGGGFGGGHFGGDGHFGGGDFGHFGGGDFGHFGSSDSFASGTRFGDGDSFGGADDRFAGGEDRFADGDFHGGAWADGGQLPTDGGISGLAGGRSFSQQNLSAESTGVRNSFNNDNFNHYNVNNVNRYGAAGWNHGYYGAGWGHAYYGGWAYPGCWCPAEGWSAAAAWTCAGAATLTSFLGLAAIGANSGGSNNVTYEGDTVIVNGQQSIPVQQYYQQAQQLAVTPSAVPPGQADQWQPLGVFSLAQPGQTQSAMLYQIAVDQTGTVRGNYLNQITGDTAQIQGYLDKSSQRIAWTVGNNQNTVYDTTLYNLLQPQSEIDIHYGPQATQQMAFVKLPQPQNGQAPIAGASFN